MARMSCTKSNLLSKVELWAEEEKSSPWYRALTRVKALMTTSVPRESVSMKFSHELMKGLTCIWEINMTTHVIKAMIIFGRLSWTKVKTMMSTNLRKIRNPSHGRREAGKQKTGSWALNGPKRILIMAALEDVALPPLLMLCLKIREELKIQHIQQESIDMHEQHDNILWYRQ